MAKATYTNLTALEAAVELANDAGMPELAKKLGVMAETEANKRERAKNAPKRQNPNTIKTRNRALSAMAAIVAAGNEPRTTAWIGEHVTDMLTPQKVSGTMGVVMREGLVAYGEKAGKAVTYYVTDAGLELLDKIE